MAITVPTTAGDVTVASGGAVTTLTVTKPANTVDGDVLLVFANFRNASGTLTSPAGWTQLGPVSTANQTAQVFVKTAASEPTSYAFSTSASSGRAVVQCCRVLGANLSTAAVIGAVSTPAAEAALTAPGITTTAANSGVFMFGTAQNAATTGVAFAAPSGWTLVSSATVNNGTSSSSSLIAFKATAAAGAVAAPSSAMTSGTSPAASNDQGWLVALAPQATTAAPTAYVRVGAAWVKHVPYVWNGSGWTAYS